MIDIAIPLFNIFLLILINGIFVAAEFGIAASPRARMAQLAENGSAAAQQVLTILRQPKLLNRYISTAQVGITIASLGLGMYGEHAVADWFIGPLEHLGWFGIATAHTIATIISVAVLTYLHVVVGEMVPKSLALQSPANTAISLAGVMAIADRLFRPMTVTLNTVGNILLRLIGLETDAATRLISAAELEYIVEESTVGGLLDPTEQVYLVNVIDFSERTVGQVMTPRTRMSAIPHQATLAETLKLVRSNRHSRYPVFAEDRDHIIGILHLKDLARYLHHTTSTANGASKTAPFDLAKIMRSAYFVPETLPLEQMLDKFRQEHIQIAVAVDEFGGTAGIVTLEDLAEEIIGEIQDEFDVELEPFTEIGPQQLRVRGDLLLGELNQHFALELEHDEAETVGGLIMSELGHVAEVGEVVSFAGVTFAVESLEGLAVRTALVTLPTPAEIDASEQAAEGIQGGTQDVQPAK